MYSHSLYSLHQQPQHGIHGLHGLHRLPHQHQQHQRPTASTLTAEAAPHSGTKCLKPAGNRFTSVCHIMISPFFKATFNISVSGKWTNFLFQVRQIDANKNYNSQFPIIFNPIFGGFLRFGTTVHRYIHTASRRVALAPTI